METVQIGIDDYLASEIVHVVRSRYKEGRNQYGREVSEKVEIINVPADYKQHDYSELIKIVRDTGGAEIYYSYRTALIETKYVNIKLCFSYNEPKVYFSFSDGRVSFRTLGMDQSIKALKRILAQTRVFIENMEAIRKELEG